MEICIMGKRIEFGEVRVGKTAISHLIEACDQDWISYGSKCSQFEDMWGALFNYEYNLATSSGTDAVLQSCLALRDDGTDGGYILTPALSFIATANAIRAAGFTPLFVDIEKETLNIDPKRLAQKLENMSAFAQSQVKGIMVVHTMGKPCDMATIMDISTNFDIPVLEDACEAHGAKHRGTYIGHFGIAASFSFYIAHLICCGEGGMVSSCDPDVNQKIISTRCHGRSGLYFDHPRYGLNSKMNDLEASIGLEGVDKFWDTFRTRRLNKNYIERRLDKFKDKIWMSEEELFDTNCPHGVSITLKSPDKLHVLTNDLDKANIHWKRNFGSIPTQHGAFKYLGHKLGDFPEAEYVGDNGIHLGVHQYLTPNDVDKITETLLKSIARI